MKALFIRKTNCSLLLLSLSTILLTARESLHENSFAIEKTPSYFASCHLKQAFDQNSLSVNITTTPSIEELQESKTTIFQKTFINYLKDIYNKPDYSLKLSHDFNDITDFLELSNEMCLTPETMYVCLRLFYNKIKQCEYIDDLAVIKLLKKMPKHLKRLFGSEQKESYTYDLSFMKHQLENLLMDKLTNHLSTLQTNPAILACELAQDLTNYYKETNICEEKNQARKHAREQLRHIIVRFLDTAINKIVFDIHDPNSIVESFIMIGNRLLSFAEKGIINHMDVLDDLFWSLTYRFIYFLDIVGAALPLNFYQDLESALDNNAIFFIEYQEQDDNITTKKELLMQQLSHAKARAFAYEVRGIISLPLLEKGKIMADEIKIGATYEHYSKKLYKVLGVGHHSETQEKVVIYQGLYDCPTFGQNPVWVRPESMFLEQVTINGVTTPRFALKQIQTIT